MARQLLRTGFVALFGVVVVSLAAATLPSPEPRRPAGGEGATGAGGGGVASPPAERPVEALSTPAVVETLVTALVALVALVVGASLLIGLFVAVRHAVTHWRTVPPAAVGATLAAAVLVALLALLWSLAGAPAATPTEPGAGGAPGGGEAAPAADSPDVTSLPLVGGVALVALLLLVLLVRLRVLDRLRGRTGGGPPSSVGRIAGESAGRLEAGADLDNEVYRAWLAMTASVTVESPATRTPGEFASAAVRAGMDPEDVRELTALFEDVRYGGHPPTGGYERRAVRTLRRIESAYAGDGA